MRLLLIAVLASYFLVVPSGTPIPKFHFSNAHLSQKTVDWSDCILISEQKEHRVAIVNVKTQAIVWEWKPSVALSQEHAKWFSNMSDAKLVYDGKYILATASGGGVALVRISDKKTVFYTYVGGNTHSAEILPDGNIVSASSTGNYLTVIKVDTTVAPDRVYKKNITIDFGHNVVWDHKNQLLWSAGRNNIHSYTYNFNCEKPDLTLKDTYAMPGPSGHDLFPIYGSNSLWLSNNTNVYRFDIKRRKLTVADNVTVQKDIKSLSSGRGSKPAIIITPKESWWTDEILDTRGNRIFQMSGLRIYKARWMEKVPFSYTSKNPFKVCN
jgi:hypothetical protein